MSLINARQDWNGTYTDYNHFSGTVLCPATPNFPFNSGTKTRYMAILPENLYVDGGHPITITGLTRGYSYPPATGYFYIDPLSLTSIFPSPLYPYLIEFNSASAGVSYPIDCYMVGSPLISEYISPVPKTATVVVASSNSTLFSKRYADYVCDGTDDDVEIQQAIDYVSGLTNGGSVVLMEGTFNVTSQINMKSNVLLQGQGNNGTIIKKMSSSIICVIFIDTSYNNFHFRDFQIDGNGDTYPTSATGVYGIFDNSGGFKYQSYTNIYAHHIYCSASGYPSSGFRNLRNMVNCISRYNKNTYVGSSAYGFGAGFTNCNNLLNCQSEYNFSSATGGSPAGRGIGFEGCVNVMNCYANYNTGTSGGYGFSNVYGTGNCLRLYGCGGTGNTTALFIGSYFSSDTSVACAVGNGNG